MGKFIDITGNKYNMLTAVKHLGATDTGRTKWLFLCDCGKEVSVEVYSVKTGKTKSCGCNRFIAVAEARTTHGGRFERMYNIYCGMLARCYNPNVSSYKRYGARGITVCQRWLDGYEFFREDMTKDYADDLTLERIDSKGDYCPENCTWKSRKKQARNTGKRINNKSGVTGVFIDETRKCACALWRSLEGKFKKKSFAWSVYTKDGAFRLACEYRAKMIEELNKQGAGYSPSHGL